MELEARGREGEGDDGSQRDVGLVTGGRRRTACFSIPLHDDATEIESSQPAGLVRDRFLPLHQHQNSRRALRPPSAARRPPSAEFATLENRPSGRSLPSSAFENRPRHVVLTYVMFPLHSSAHSRTACVCVRAHLITDGGPEFDAGFALRLRK